MASPDEGRLQPRRAWQALRILLKDKEDTEQVFVIIRSLTGKSLLRGFNRFTATRNGTAILAERRRLIEKLSDREALRALPPASLGRAYLAFMERENLSAAGLVDASLAAEGETGAITPEHDARTLYAERLRDAHDLWHVVSGYGRDGLGELCLLGFTFAQTLNPGIGLICLAGANQYARLLGFDVVRALLFGYRSGRTAAWLPAADWEGLLGMPLDAVRAELKIRTPRIYPELLQSLPA
ncbi:MAG: Coq4 family protein [Pseudomonadales bacterium]|nr:hypothetical protein [Pseudomonadales bacterium]